MAGWQGAVDVSASAAFPAATPRLCHCRRHCYLLCTFLSLRIRRVLLSFCLLHRLALLAPIHFLAFAKHLLSYWDWGRAVCPPKMRASMYRQSTVPPWFSPEAVTRLSSVSMRLISFHSQPSLFTSTDRISLFEEVIRLYLEWGDWDAVKRVDDMIRRELNDRRRTSSNSNSNSSSGGGAGAALSLGSCTGGASDVAAVGRLPSAVHADVSLPSLGCLRDMGGGEDPDASAAGRLRPRLSDLGSL